MNNWRIYRLPGSRETWHIDSGPETQVINVRGYECLAPSRSIDIGGNNSPRAWIEVNKNFELHIVNGIARFSVVKCRCKQVQPCQKESPKQSAAAEVQQ